MVPKSFKRTLQEAVQVFRIGGLSQASVGCQPCILLADYMS